MRKCSPTLFLKDGDSPTPEQNIKFLYFSTLNDGQNPKLNGENVICHHHNCLELELNGYFIGVRELKGIVSE